MELKNNKIILLIILLIIFKVYNDESMLVFPFKTIGIILLNNFEEENKNNIYGSLKFCKDHYSSRMVTPIQIGYPKQDIIAFINFNYNNLLI